MRTLTRSDITWRSDKELDALTAHFIKAMERTEPLSPEWQFCKFAVDSAQAERRRRLNRIQPRLF
jgi:hypothetical protein